MTLQDAFQQLVSQLASIYEKTEAMNIAELVLEKITGLEKADRIVNKDILLSSDQKESLESYTNDLLQHRPVQYVIGEAWFAGMKFYVNEQVLIPRPETEELVAWIPKSEKILDIGTGSGCIPIALKKKFPQAAIIACDISEAALEVAAGNAKSNGVDVQFIQCDILNKNEWNKLPDVDVIISNPPYIPLHDRTTMRKNVLSYEPPLALFVPDENPLLFYRTIAELALFKKATTIYFEIHEEQGDAVIQLLKEKGFNTIKLKKDMQGKDRMVKGVSRTRITVSF